MGLRLLMLCVAVLLLVGCAERSKKTSIASEIKSRRAKFDQLDIPAMHEREVQSIAAGTNASTYSGPLNPVVIWECPIAELKATGNTKNEHWEPVDLSVLSDGQVTITIHSNAKDENQMFFISSEGKLISKHDLKKKMYGYPKLINSTTPAISINNTDAYYGVSDTCNPMKLLTIDLKKIWERTDLIQGLCQETRYSNDWIYSHFEVTHEDIFQFTITKRNSSEHYSKRITRLPAFFEDDHPEGWKMRLVKHDGSLFISTDHAIALLSPYCEIQWMTAPGYYFSDSDGLMPFHETPAGDLIALAYDLTRWEAPSRDRLREKLTDTSIDVLRILDSGKKIDKITTNKDSGFRYARMAIDNDNLLYLYYYPDSSKHMEDGFDSKLVCQTLTGTSNWEVDFKDNWSESSILKVDCNSNTYLGRDELISCFDKEGIKRWELMLSDNVVDMAFSLEGVLYIMGSRSVIAITDVSQS